MNILTIVGDSSQFQAGAKAIERIARENGAGLIYSVGHPGWLPLMKQFGYQTERALIMKKVL